MAGRQQRPHFSVRRDEVARQGLLPSATGIHRRRVSPTMSEMMSLVSETKMGEMMRFKGAHVERDAILTGVPWSVVSSLGSRQTEEVMQERGVHGC
jgi:hypothetical protein